jgi:hypothetical protein
VPDAVSIDAIKRRMLRERAVSGPFPCWDRSILTESLPMSGLFYSRN